MEISLFLLKILLVSGPKILLVSEKARLDEILLTQDTDLCNKRLWAHDTPIIGLLLRMVLVGDRTLHPLRP
jgi:hypothetical protein